MTDETPEPFETMQTFPPKPTRRIKDGDLILNRYRVTGTLGQGGMGVVYKCRDEVGGIDAAVKMLPPEVAHSADEMEKIRENFQLVSRLSHPNIAAIRTLEKDAETGDYYLVMECVEGENLKQFQKKKGGRLAFQDVIGIAEQMADALDYAHGEKIMHRDIKPANVMIKENGTIKVLDFGLAREIHSSLSMVSKKMLETSGTIPYMAPEQMIDAPQDSRTDQYALAAVVYELFSGKCPFTSHEIQVLCNMVQTQEPEKPKGLDAGAWHALAKGLAKEKEDRYTNCRALLEAIQNPEAAAAGSAPAKASGSRAGLWLVAVALIGFLLLLGAGYGLWAMVQKKMHALDLSPSSVAQRGTEGLAAAEASDDIVDEMMDMEAERLASIPERDIEEPAPVVKAMPPEPVAPSVEEPSPPPEDVPTAPAVDAPQVVASVVTPEPALPPPAAVAPAEDVPPPPAGPLPTKVVVILPEQVDVERFWYHYTAESQHIVQTQVERALTRADFDVVDLAAASMFSDQWNVESIFNARDAVDLARSLQATHAVIGTALAVKSSQSTAYGLQVYRSSADVTARLIRLSDGKVLAVEEANATGGGESQRVAAQDALKQAGKTLAKKLSRAANDLLE